MTTSTIENNETIQEAIRELEEQWKKENEERMNDYIEKLNVFEGYVNEQYSINKEHLSLNEILLPKTVEHNKIHSENTSLSEKKYIEVQQCLTYLRGIDKKTSPSLVREMFDSYVRKSEVYNISIDKLIKKESDLVDQMKMIDEDRIEWIDVYNKISEKIRVLLDGDQYLTELCWKLPVSLPNFKLCKEITILAENKRTLFKEQDIELKKTNKFRNKINLTMDKIEQRMNNLGFGDIYDEVITEFYKQY